jgi:fatty-acid peroxygenase
MSYKTIPKEEGFENGLKVLREGYNYIPNRTKIYQSDIFETTLLGQKAIVLSGEEAARVFYDESKVKRSGAAPKFATSTLLGEDGVQTLDDAEHRNRKQYFLDLMSDKRIKEFGMILKKEFLKAAIKWMEQSEIVFYEESKKVLTRAVCQWSGVPLPEEEVEKRTQQLADLFENVAQVNPKFAKGVISRKTSTAWAKGLIQKVRAGQLHPDKDTALYQIAHLKDLDGTLLDINPAATDLLNVLRPTVAVSIYLTFVALSLHQFPEVKNQLRAKDKENDYYENFVQEVRRYYPFFPFNAGTSRKDFVWNEYFIEEDTLIVFDFYGTNHDERLWENPKQFNPDRFKDWETSPTDQVQYRLLAQGGGDYLTGHRCPGEWITVEAMKVTAEFLTKDIAFDVPEQDLGYSMVEMPTKPKSGVIFERVR